MKIRISSAANRDLIEGYHFYENQKENLGTYFLDSLFSDIDSLEIYAGIHPVFFGRYYRLLSKRFPFAVYYRLNTDEILVYAVLDCRRDPAWIRDRLR